MLKETMTYIDYDGNERTEDFYFNLTKAELTEMDLGMDGGMMEYLHKIVNSKDMKKILENFKIIIAKAYGEKSPDGKRLMKSPELFKAFSETEAYSDLFVRLCSDAAYSANFIKAILPKPSNVSALPNQTSTPKE